MWETNRHAGFPTERIKAPLDFKNYCRPIPDFPKKGICFWDITPLLADKMMFSRAINTMSWKFQGKIDAVVCIEARGFLIGSAMAYKLNCGLVPVRKFGKLPHKTLKATYDLEYGTDILEIHEDSIKPNQRILIVDDILATGGTASAVVKMARELKGNVIGCVFLGELPALNGRSKLDVPVHSLIKF